MKHTLILLLLVFVLGSSSAQEKKWTLEECVAHAVENNLSIAQFQLDLERVKLDESDAFGALLPNLNSSINASNNIGFSIVPGSNAPTTQATFSANGGFSSRVTLFAGLTNMNALQRAKLSSIASQYRLEDLKDDIRLNVANTYLQVLSNKETLKVARAQYAVTEQDLKRTKELVDSGVTPKGDLLEIQATAANQEQQIVNAENVVLLSKIMLSQLLQITDYKNFDIAADTFTVPPSSILDNSAKDIFNKALTFRNDIKLSESNVLLAEKDVKIAKGALYPTLAASFGYNTVYSNRNQIPDQNNVFFRPSFKDQLWIFDGVSYGAQLSIPVFNGFSVKNRIKRAAISLQQTALQLEQDKLDLESNIQQAYADVTTFEKAYEAAQKTLEARRLAYNYSKERYTVGLMNAFDFSQAQSRVDNAEAQVINAKYAYIFRLKILEFYFGIPIRLN